MATTTQRRDFLSRKLVTPASNSKDAMGRSTTASADFLGRALAAPVRANSTVYVRGDVVEFTTGELFLCEQGGTSAASQPSPPGNGNAVVDGGVTWRRQQ